MFCGYVAMFELSENECAVLALLVDKPRALFPPHVASFAQMLAKRGLAIFDKGEWFVTALGLKASMCPVH